MVEKSFQLTLISIYRFSDSKNSDWWNMNMVTRFFWSQEIAAPATFNQNVAGDATVLTYRNIPPLEEHPYGNPGEDRRMANVRIFRTFPFQGMSPGKFWDNFGYDFVRLIYDMPLIRSEMYTAWIKDLKKNRPQGVEGVKFVYRAFSKRICRSDQLTPQQLNKLHNRSPGPFEPGPDMLSQAFQRGHAEREYHGALMFRVMRDCGLPVKLLFAPYSRQTAFKPRDLNPFSLDPWHPVLALLVQVLSYLRLLLIGIG